MDVLNPLTIPRGDLRYLRKVFPAKCQPTDVVGNCVYVSGPEVAGSYQVTTADPADITKMPAVGVIESISGTDCMVHVLGELPNTYTGLTPGKVLFVGSDGRLSESIPAPVLGGYAFVQSMGAALSAGVVLMLPSFNLTKRIG